MKIRIARKILKLYRKQPGRYSFEKWLIARRRVDRADPEQRADRAWHDNYARTQAKADSQRIKVMFRSVGLGYIRANS